MRLSKILYPISLLTLTFCINKQLETLKTHIRDKDTTAILFLIEERSEILNSQDENGSSGLMLLAYSNLDTVFQKAIQLKTSFSFHEAIIAGKIDIVSDYLEQKDLVNTYSNDGFTPLALAAFFNQTTIAKQLLMEGADPNLAATNPAKVNALHAAVAKENEELCRLFIENGVDVNAVQTQNVTALHSAAHRGNLTLVKLLVENGAKIDMVMDNGDTALSIAERDGHQIIIDYFKNDRFLRHN